MNTCAKFHAFITLRAILAIFNIGRSPALKTFQAVYSCPMSTKPVGVPRQQPHRRQA